MKQASISFNDAADFYDATRALRQEVAPDLIAALVRELRTVGAAPVLEAGVGTGRIARPLAEHGFRVCGIDIAPRMLARLREQLGPEHVEPDLLLGDATRLPFASGSFGAALLCHVLHLIPPWRDAVSEIRRVLRSGGVLLHHGDHSVGDSDWDVAYRKWEELLAERGFVRRVRPRIEDMSAAFAATGGQCRTETIAEWDEQSSPAEEMELARNKVHSWTWEIPDDLFQECLPEIGGWAAEHYGGMDTRLHTRMGYTLQIWRFP
jgi:ubiquinone/menaquinone biosynthesis C-methylase UbiE